MTAVDVLNALGGMVLIVDTREQRTPAMDRRLKQIGVPYVREKLNAGDYSAKFPMPDGTWYQLPVAVERKMNPDELAMCYCKGRGRFQREFERAQADGVKLYLLLESTSWEVIYSGKYRSKMTPQAFTASILAWLARYNCQILMCSQLTTGRLIHDVLFREGKEHLERMIDE